MSVYFMIRNGFSIFGVDRNIVVDVIFCFYSACPDNIALKIFSRYPSVGSLFPSQTWSIRTSHPVLVEIRLICHSWKITYNESSHSAGTRNKSSHTDILYSIVESEYSRNNMISVRLISVVRKCQIIDIFDWWTDIDKRFIPCGPIITAYRYIVNTLHVVSRSMIIPTLSV